ncbi:MAG: hypothetical protein ACJ71M_00860 [Nitrososphaeraceae archaeon]
MTLNLLNIEKSTTKAIALVDKMDNMLQRQIVKALGKQLDIEDPAYTNTLSHIFIL